MDQEILDIVRAQKQARTAKYERYMAGVDAVLRSSDSKHKAMVERANANLARTKLLGPGQVHVDSTLANVSVQYANGDYIGLELMPPVIVAKASDTYFIYNKRDRLAYPDDALGARGEANEIEESRSSDKYSCADYGLKNYVDVSTLENQDAPLNEMVDLVEAITEGIAFKEEKRIATIVTTAANYPTGNKVSLSAGVRWDSISGGNPVKDLQDARAALWNGRGPGKRVAWSSFDVYNVLARHPAILDLFKYGGTAPGLATPRMIAQFFGFDDYLVSEAREDTANEGQAAGYGRIWGNFFGVARVATRPSIRNASFGATFRFGPVTTDEWFDIAKGRKGGYYARVSVAEDHKVIAADTSYLISTPIG